MQHTMTEWYRSQGWWPGEALADRFARHVEAAPDRVSVVDDSGATLTRRELWDRAGELADHLGEQGIGARDVVLVLLPNRVEWQVAFLACLRLTAVPATIPMASDTKTLAHVVGLIGARGVITQRTHRAASPAASVLEAMRTAGRLCDAVVLEEDGSLTGERQPGQEPPKAGPELDHLMFTSSTTGLPKAVMHTQDTLAAVNIGFSERFSITEDTPLFMPSPLGHSVGAWHGGRLSLFSGATLVLQDRWDPERALELVDTYECAFTAAATPFLKDLVDAAWDGDRPKLAPLRNFLCGGAPVPPSLVEQALEQAPHTFVTVLWGMTEGGVTTSVPGDDPVRTARLAGKPLPGLEIATIGADGERAERGELVMRGPGVFVGYLGQEDLYTDSLTEDGFFRTGDLATIEPDGYLALTGRLKDLIVRGGVNLSPVPIEDAISAHPLIRRVAVVGMPDPRLGERICAVVVIDERAELGLEELNAWLLEQGLSKRLLPERLIAMPELPATAAGKIRKNDLRKQLEVAP